LRLELDRWGKCWDLRSFGRWRTSGRWTGGGRPQRRGRGSSTWSGWSERWRHWWEKEGSSLAGEPIEEDWLFHKFELKFQVFIRITTIINNVGTFWNLLVALLTTTSYLCLKSKCTKVFCTIIIILCDIKRTFECCNKQLIMSNCRTLWTINSFLCYYQVGLMFNTLSRLSHNALKLFNN
jgi:hypothetical protein